MTADICLNYCPNIVLQDYETTGMKHLIISKILKTSDELIFGVCKVSFSFVPNIR